jgi:hypothetical protein
MKKKTRDAAMTPEDIAERFVTYVLCTTFHDVMDMTDPEPWHDRGAPNARSRLHEAVETAVRRGSKVRDNLEALEKAVGRVVPEEHQAKFIALSNAIGAEMHILRQANYLIGVAVGRMLHPAASAHLAKGWRYR